MNTCPNCGKVVGLHASILQGCVCQYSMQAPPQRTWVGLTDEDCKGMSAGDKVIAMWANRILKEKNT
jgi:hypothetical protein